MLAVLAGLPANQDDFGFEYKWDGVRAICFLDGSGARLESRNLLDMTASYPELKGLGQALGPRTAVLDGEIVAFDRDGRPDFSMLQHRIGLTADRALARGMHEVPVTYMVFDVLYLDGRFVTDKTYEERRRLLEGLGLSGSNWQTPPSHRGAGDSMLGAAREQRLEGIMAKRLTSRYTPGLRSKEWRKIKIVRRQEFVVGGWVPVLQAREAPVGAILIGYYDRTVEEARKSGRGQRLLYAGKVGTGFTERERESLKGALDERRRHDSPFDGPVKDKAAIFAEPDLVAEIEFRGWTSERRLRQPSYKGLRTDKAAQDVTLE
jgi:bifunctional non-homologous end joining protein LigD